MLDPNVLIDPMILIMYHYDFDSGPNSYWSKNFRRASISGDSYSTQFRF